MVSYNFELNFATVQNVCLNYCKLSMQVICRCGILKMINSSIMPKIFMFFMHLPSKNALIVTRSASKPGRTMTGSSCLVTTDRVYSTRAHIIASTAPFTRRTSLKNF